MSSNVEVQSVSWNRIWSNVFGTELGQTHFFFGVDGCVGGGTPLLELHSCTSSVYTREEEGERERLKSPPPHTHTAHTSPVFFCATTELSSYKLLMIIFNWTGGHCISFILHKLRLKEVKTKFGSKATGLLPKTAAMVRVVDNARMLLIR